MEFGKLKYFIAVAEELHFGKAAARLNISQPPLSMQIKRFEQELGITLFNRNNRKVELTPGGTILFQEASQALRRLEMAVQEAATTQAGLAGNLDVGFVAPAIDGPLSDVIRVFRDRYPKIKLNLQEQSSNSQLAKLKSGQLDMGFVRLFDNETYGFESTLFIREPYVAAIPSGHRLSRKKSIKITDLAGEPLILFPRSIHPKMYDQLFLSLFRDRGIEPVIAQEALTKHATTALVSADLGIGLVPRSTSLSKRENVVFRPVEKAFPLVEIAILYPPDPPAATRNFLDVAEEHASIEPRPQAIAHRARIVSAALFKIHPKFRVCFPFCG